MKKIVIFFSFFIFSCGDNTTSVSTEVHYEQDSLYIELERDLLYLKNLTYISYLGRLETSTLIKYNIDFKTDSCYIKTNIKDASSMHYFQTSGVSLQYLFKDSNRENLIKKWVEKDFFVIPLENGANVPHSYDHYKALEFYNSKDLEKYIDSVRTVELKLLKNQ